MDWATSQQDFLSDWNILSLPETHFRFSNTPRLKNGKGIPCKHGTNARQNRL